MQTTISISPRAAKGLGYITRIANASMLNTITRILNAENISRIYEPNEFGAVWFDSLNRWVLPRAPHITITLNLSDKIYLELAKMAHVYCYRHSNGMPNISQFLECIGLGLYKVYP
jgi:hypothetical protein